MPQLTLTTGQISEPVEVGPGTRVTATGSGYVEWTTSTLADVRNGIATWQVWPKGSTVGYADTLRRVVMRARAVGALAVVWEEGRRDEGPEGAYWQEEVPSWAKDSAGNLMGLTGPAGTAASGNVGVATAAAAGMFQRVVNCAHSPYSAKFDGVTDDSAAIQAAIDAVAALGGGTVECPAGTAIASVVLKQNVTLSGAGQWFGYPAGAVLATQIRWNSAGWVIDTPVTRILHTVVRGINVLGNSTLTATGGIRFQDVLWGAIKRCGFNNFADEGIKILSSSVACVIEDVLAINCLLNRTRAAKTGVLDIAGNDHMISRAEATASLSARHSVDLYLCAVVVRGSNCFLDRIIGEISEVGIYFLPNSGLHSVTGCRADLNFGNGFEIGCQNSDFAACRAVNNSRHATNTYSGWLTNATFGGNTFAACHAYSNIAETHKFGFEDLINTGTVTGRNEWVGCRSTGHGTRAFFTENFAGSGPLIGAHVALPSTGATFDIGQTTLVRPGHSGATTITDMVNGQQGQTVRIIGNVNITMQNNAAIKNNTGADKVLASNRIYTYTRDNGVWYEA